MQYTQEQIKELLHYDPETGKFTWNERAENWFVATDHNTAAGACKSWNSSWAKKEAFTAVSHGYKVGAIKNKLYRAHRLSFFYMKGYMPEQVDHINGDRGDNRWENLRAVDNMENHRNLRKRSTNTSGVVGVIFRPKGGYGKKTDRYIANITVNYETKFLGCFDTLEEAAKARKEAEIKYGFLPDHGTDKIHVYN